MKSKKYTLNQKDIEKILVGAAVAMAGAALTYLSEIVTHIDFGDMTPIIVAVISIAVNAARKYLTGK